MKEAVTKMKAELGDDAVILHTKKYKEGGILGYGSKEMVEITAAIEDEKPAAPKEEEKPQRPTISVMPQSILSQYKTNGTAEGVALAEKEISPSLRTDAKPTLSDYNTKENDTVSEDDMESSNLKPSLINDNMQSKDQASSLKAAMTPDIKQNQDKVLMPYEVDKSFEQSKIEETPSDSQGNVDTANVNLSQSEENKTSLSYEDNEKNSSNEEDTTLKDTSDNLISEENSSNVELQESNFNASNTSKVNLEKSKDETDAANIIVRDSKNNYNDVSTMPTSYNEAPVMSGNQNLQVQPDVNSNSDSNNNQPLQQQNQVQLQPMGNLQQSINSTQNPTQNQQIQQQSLSPQMQKVAPQNQAQDFNQSTQSIQPANVSSVNQMPMASYQAVQPIQNMPLNAEVQQAQNIQNVPQQQQAMSANPNTQPVSMQPNPYQMANKPLSDAQMNQPVELQNQVPIDMTQPLTPAQLAQAQAMMMAQFNQMQMAQAMQQAMAQVQQAQAQVQTQTQTPSQQIYNQPQQQSEPQEQRQLSRPSSENNEVDRKSQEKIKKLEDEIAQMKALLAQVIGKDTNRGSISLHEALRKQEVDEKILSEMAAHANAGETLSDSQSREAKSTLTNFLKENINFSEGIKLNRHGVRIAALLGTTGVGKTTTLAKIAAKFVLEQGITAALITADTYRISAVEQLRTYSDILGLPLEIVYSPEELSKAINKHRNRDLILIDTAGRSQHNDYQMKELQEFLRTNPRIEKHIVLSTTTKSSDANDILDKFSVCEPDKIIFTKTDETAHVGLIVNLLCKKRLSLSYITNGQSVPDDIIPATANNLAELLLKKRN